MREILESKSKRVRIEKTDRGVQASIVISQKDVTDFNGLHWVIVQEQPEAKEYGNEMLEFLDTVERLVSSEFEANTNPDMNKCVCEIIGE